MALIQDHLPPPDYASRALPLIALQVVLVVFASVFYGLRIYTRARILDTIGTDDWLMGAALFFSFALAVNTCVGTKFGWARHLSAIPRENLSPILQNIFASEILFTLTTSLVKISILFLYLRIAVTKPWKRVIYGSIAFIVIWTIAFCALIIFQCNPVSDYWDPSSKNCYPAEIALFLHGLTNTITDIYVYVLPMRLVWKTNLPKRKRLELVGIFGAGFLVCVAGGIRLYYTIATQTSDDSTWVGYYMYTWEAIEVNLGIVCASAPPLKALTQRILQKHFSPCTDSTPSVGNYQMSSRQNRHRNTFRAKTKGPIGDDVNSAREMDWVDNESQENLAKVHLYKVDATQRV
ncbi:hypothetical protein V499_01183 [Pseudogymnoascus sp. VKM F-103]|uniref:Rhodopsin domain-containing protein n=1 Tax=Pseudogymnoascus verrucosus TaxID=342668 RepID=A0A1B8GBG9_9PEZI|nr:uncharacterized protein VE01_09231 [Pseudogymnoascus verrucosus]KFY79925.1 hypothetical protein V499_01183 [Pseudogymnoascus sp. VKM F-103]OBT93160.1 hypothetical protein VE01_09231 [Pseudogymnoascus verrucosus]